MSTHAIHIGLPDGEYEVMSRDETISGLPGDMVRVQLDMKLRRIPSRDFGWALQQMRAGKTVRRRSRPASILSILNGRFLCIRNYPVSLPATIVDNDDLLATDWELAE